MYTKTKPARIEAMELCLCGVCAGAFYNDPQFRIRRADRSQTVRELNGVRYVNDSKATNVDAAQQALLAFPRIRWIAGGLGKDGGIAALQPHLGEVVKAYLIGHSARDFALLLGATPYEVVDTMEAAVARANAEAQPGETVLLAPAAASFDQYPNFEKRGEHFTGLVNAL